MRRLLFATVLFASSTALAGDFRLAVLDVGQGDASVVVTPSGCAALFDGGPAGSGATIKAWLKAHGVTRLDWVVTSHYHADHIGGIDEVDAGADAVPVVNVLDRGGSYSSQAFTNYAAHYAGKRVTAQAGQVYSLCGEVSLRVVAANANGLSTTDENAKSVAVKVSYGDLDVLLGGDLTGASPDVETGLAPAVGAVEVYKVHHHGSREASNARFLDALRPTNALISVGISNTYGHPSADALQRLAAVGAEVWQTEDPAAGVKLGHLEVASPDGRHYTVSQGARAEAFVVQGGTDVTAPSVPANVAVTLASSTALRVQWAASTDDTAVATYHVWWSGDQASWQPLAATSATTYLDTELAVDTDVWYRVTALDAAGNESAPSLVAHGRTVDLVAPTTPAGLAATAGSRAITLSWQASTDDVYVSGYRVYRDGVAIASPSGTSFTDTVGPAETHRYAVLAFDAAGNASSLSAELPATSRAELAIPQKSFSTSTMYLFVKATYSLPNATLTASADGVALGTMIWSATAQNYTIRRTLKTVPQCITVTGPQGESATSCF